MLILGGFDIVDVSNMTNSEDEILDFLYEDIYSIKRELITLLSLNDNSR